MANRITEDIKNNSFSSLYLLYGKEDFLRKMYKDRLVKALIPDGNSMNLNIFKNDSGRRDESDSKIPEIISLCNTVPFFAERRVIVCENLGLFKNAYDNLLELFGNIPETTCIIITESEADARKKLFKFISSHGVVEKCDQARDSDLELWILGRVKKAGLRMSRAAYNEFLHRTSTSMFNMDRELEKLISYCLYKEDITVDDVTDICTISVSESIFKITDAIAERNKESVFREYNLLLRNQAEPRDILYRTIGQFVRIADVASGIENKMSIKDIAKALGTKEYPVEKWAKAAGRFEKKSLKRCIALGSEYLTKMNTGLINESSALEMYLLQCLSA